MLRVCIKSWLNCMHSWYCVEMSPNLIVIDLFVAWRMCWIIMFVEKLQIYHFMITNTCYHKPSITLIYLITRWYMFYDIWNSYKAVTVLLYFSHFSGLQLKSYPGHSSKIALYLRVNVYFSDRKNDTFILISEKFCFENNV